VPAHDRLGPDDGYGIQDARKAAIKPNEQNPIGPTQIQSKWRALGPVVGLVGIEGGVVSGVINLESSGVEAPDWRPRHEKHYHEA
jgi:hypothetical protein